MIRRKRIYTVYLLECQGGAFYCGYTSDLQKRLEKHQTGKGGRYTRSHRPVRLVYAEKHDSLSHALSREHAIKRLTRMQKVQLIHAQLPKRIFNKRNSQYPM